MYFEALEAIIKVLAELRIFKISKKKNRENIFEAVEAIHEAANETFHYYSTIEAGKEKPNIDLSKIWLKAASAVRELDNNLYNRLLMKAEFWADPNLWTAEMSEKNKIYLDTILEDSTRILNK